MSIETVLYDILADIVTTYPTFPRDNPVEFPFFVYTVEYLSQELTLDGVSGPIQSVLHVDIWAKTKKEVHDLAIELREELHGLQTSGVEIVLFAGGSTIEDIFGKEGEQFIEAHHQACAFNCMSNS